MAIISAEHSDQLYWLGRYSERVYTTLKIFEDHFDSMIDLKTEEYEDFAESRIFPIFTLPRMIFPGVIVLMKRTPIPSILI